MVRTGIADLFFRSTPPAPSETSRSFGPLGGLKRPLRVPPPRLGGSTRGVFGEGFVGRYFGVLRQAVYPRNAAPFHRPKPSNPPDCSTAPRLHRGLHSHGVPGPGDGAQPRRRDRPAGRFANPIGPSLDPVKRRVDLLQGVLLGTQQTQCQIMIEFIRGGIGRMAAEALKGGGYLGGPGAVIGNQPAPQPQERPPMPGPTTYRGGPHPDPFR